ncbi:MAG: hypothetical protein WBW35_02990, partial [Xanthobacteraceae bacterium]
MSATWIAKFRRQRKPLLFCPAMHRPVAHAGRDEDVAVVVGDIIVLDKIAAEGMDIDAMVLVIVAVNKCGLAQKLRPAPARERSSARAMPGHDEDRIPEPRALEAASRP